FERRPGQLLGPARQRTAALERELLVPVRGRRVPAPLADRSNNRGPARRDQNLCPQVRLAGIPLVPAADPVRRDRRRAGWGRAEGGERRRQRRLGAALDG